MGADKERAAVVLHLQNKASALDALGIVWLATLYRTAAYEISIGQHRKENQNDQ